MDTRLPILDEDGWTLYDGEERNRVNPVNFEIPDKEAVERMWVSVKGKKEEFYWGQLDNDPATTNLIKAGDEVFFLPQHVISIY